MKKQKRRVSRRNFLRGAGLALGVPYVIPSTALGAPGISAASERVTVGKLGCGGRGTGIAGVGGQVVAACDPWRDRRERWAKMVGCKVYLDYRDVLDRDDIDAVCIASPDHWHVPMAIAAAKAGKDIYCEKPLGVSVRHNQICRDTVRQYGRVFQYGTQQRSMAHCHYGCELVRAGYLGEIERIEVLIPDGKWGASSATAPVPEELDYERWLGPATWREYCNQADYSANGGYGWCFTYDYSLGYVAGWGAHPLDILQFAYDTHLAGRWEVEGTGWIPLQGICNTVMRYNVDFRFANGVTMNVKAGRPYDFNDNATKFIGTEGTLTISRRGLVADPVSLLQVQLKVGDERLPRSRNHGANFAEAVKSRVDPVSNIEDAVRSDSISHIIDIAVRSKRKIVWDPLLEEIIGDDDAARRLERVDRESLATGRRRHS